MGQGGRGGHNESFNGQPEGSKIFVHTGLDIDTADRQETLTPRAGDTGEQRFTLRPEDMSRLVATSTGQFDPRLLTPIYICTNVGAPIFMMYK